MAYRIDFDNPLGDEVRDIVSELLSGAAELLEKQPDGPHEAIHDARKNIKRARALYRLIASQAADFTASESSRLSNLGLELSHLRDSAALAETTDYLEKQTDDPGTRAAIRRLGDSMKHRRDSLAGQEKITRKTLTACCAGLREAEKALSALDLPRLRRQANKCVAAGWQKTGKKALKALSTCQQTVDEEPFHDLRKRAQDRFMHAMLLRSIWPSGMVSIQRQAKALVDVLGHEHDLAMLNEQVIGQAETGLEERPLLLQAITAERTRLQLAAREIGLDIFDGKPKRDAEIVAYLIGNRR